MKRSENNHSTFEIITDRARYAVDLEHLKNTKYGNPRYKAIIIVLEVFGQPHNPGSFYSVIYQFNGSYIGDRCEAEKAVNAYENEIINK
jgi:hypothetical protein